MAVPRPRPGQGAATRASAARVVAEVLLAGRALSEALEGELEHIAEERDRALVQEIGYGVMRRLPRLKAFAERLLPRPFAGQDPQIQALLLVGLYQLTELRIPDHAAIGETVQAARLLAKGWATGLLNALLRRFQRERGTLEAAPPQSPEVAWCFPAWLIERIRAAWPEDWERILVASNQRPPLGLRVNQVRIGRTQYSERLAAVGITARPIAHAPQGLALEQRVIPTTLPGYGEGLFSVQDGAAQLAAPLMDLALGQRVLDACAAPGGKTTHIAELAHNAITLTAVDREPSRVARIEENLARLGLVAETSVGDAIEPKGAWSERRYQRILLDVPCTATGVIRRHPDIKWLRQPLDLTRLVETQARMLRALWPLLAPGGVLLYATCSLLPEENECQMAGFLTENADARERPIAADWGRARSVGVQILPGEDDMDGFYYARVEKCAA